MAEQRYRRIYVDIHIPVKVKDTSFGTQDLTYPFARTQLLLSLQAIVGVRQGLLDRADFAGTWEGSAWAEPAINDGDHIVINLEGVQEKVLEVIKSMVVKRKRVLFLRETGVLQDHT